MLDYSPRWLWEQFTQKYVFEKTFFLELSRICHSKIFELCASTIQFNTLNKALLPHQLQKFCQDSLYDELNFWFIKWDAAIHLLSHMYHQLGYTKFFH